MSNVTVQQKDATTGKVTEQKSTGGAAHVYLKSTDVPDVSEKHVIIPDVTGTGDDTVIWELDVTNYDHCSFYVSGAGAVVDVYASFDNVTYVLVPVKTVTAAGVVVDPDTEVATTEFFYLDFKSIGKPKKVRVLQKGGNAATIAGSVGHL